MCSETLDREKEGLKDSDKIINSHTEISEVLWDEEEKQTSWDSSPRAWCCLRSRRGDSSGRFCMAPALQAPGGSLWGVQLEAPRSSCLIVCRLLDPSQQRGIRHVFPRSSPLIPTTPEKRSLIFFFQIPIAFVPNPLATSNMLYCNCPFPRLCPHWGQVVGFTCGKQVFNKCSSTDSWPLL